MGQTKMINNRIKEGNYEKLGISYRKQWTNITFYGEKEDDCAVVLVSKTDGSKEKINVPGEYCLGSLRSIAISDLPIEDYVYYFEINGERMIDPFAHGICGREVWNDRTRKEKDYMVAGSFVREEFDWGDSHAPEIPRTEMVMYKLHVRGFTMDSGKKKGAGTFAALKDKIPYLKKLGITTIELMPIYEFEELELPPKMELPSYVKWKEEDDDTIKIPEPPKEALPKVNYWGYKAGNYFAVKASYAEEPLSAAQEFQLLVRALHENGMECVMEMYFPEDANHNLVLEALRYWTRMYHVDGFHLLGCNLPITAVVQDNLLSRTKIFYEYFEDQGVIASRKHKNLFVYKEEYLYPARMLLNNFNGSMHEFTDQQRKQSPKLGYVNYLSTNNGFTLADVFMYNEKHNAANGENNTDGNVWNFSSNCGVEGPTKKRYINLIRRLKWRTSLLMLLTAQGVPLIWQGDEMMNTQEGNNNAYCQDNPTGWLNWKNEKNHKRELDFLRGVIEFRKAHPILAHDIPFQFSDYKGVGCPDLSYHGENAWVLEPQEGQTALGIMYCGAYESDDAEDIYVAYNFSSAATTIAMPEAPRGRSWFLAIDSGNEAKPFVESEEAFNLSRVMVRPDTVLVFVSKEVKE
jgi:glycogen operon protein